VTKLASYLRFISSGIASNYKNGNVLRFMSEELEAKLKRLSNEAMRRRFDAAHRSEFTSYQTPAELPNVRVLSLCHGGGVPEQKLSILSFLRHVGTPQKWSVVSDGTISKAQANSLRCLHPAIEVIDWSIFLSDENRGCYEVFSQYTVFAKKFALESNFPVDRVSIYTDTDVVFFEGGHKLRELLTSMGEETFYQQDLPGYLDPSILTSDELSAPPLNAGFFIQGKKINWSIAIARLERAIASLTPDERIGDLEKLEQAITHAAHFMAGSNALDDGYVLQISDRLDRVDTFAGPCCVMRHYVRPVRHKMWIHAKDYLR
jgi:hypothetical protein